MTDVVFRELLLNFVPEILSGWEGCELRPAILFLLKKYFISIQIYQKIAS